MATAAQPQNDNSSTRSASSMDSLKNAIGNNDLVGKAKAFAKEHRWATATLAGVVGVALLNTLRGR
ncbi:hypothetical protein [Sphingomonas sp.]|jgi:hypothetical protein|uniref:hypothetical protein n=1 Tax=Sphingomonas sp. TaxID=28214 RepID=UPI002DB657AF|nr:hypothetical protein [Sphingomonas sp.]HEU4968903.1 hypothetical protein [Sphingomonas sp.]